MIKKLRNDYRKTISINGHKPRNLQVVPTIVCSSRRTEVEEPMNQIHQTDNTLERSRPDSSCRNLQKEYNDIHHIVNNKGKTSDGQRPMLA